MTTEKPRSLHSKLAQIMYEAERIPKNGTAPQVMGGYKFVQVGDAADYIRRALAEHSISMLPTKVEVLDKTEHETKSGGSMTTVDLRMTWTLTDGITGQTATIESYGAGADGGDKYSGKATTSAMKYALLAGFLLSTGEDTELGDTSNRGGRSEPPATIPHDGLIGTFATSGTQDAQLRETPDGWVMPFRLKDGRTAGQIVVAHDAIAQALALITDIVGQRVTCWGTYSDESVTKNGRTIGYKVLHLTRIQTPDWDLPAPEADTAPLWDDAPPSDAEMALLHA